MCLPTVPDISSISHPFGMKHGHANIFAKKGASSVLLPSALARIHEQSSLRMYYGVLLDIVVLASSHFHIWNDRRCPHFSEELSYVLRDCDVAEATKEQR